MRKTVFAFLLIPFLSFVTADWITTKIDERTSIEFPTETESKDLNGNTMWLNQISEDARCMVMVMDFAKMGADSATLAEEMNRPESYEQFKQGVVGEIEGASLISEKNTHWKGYKTFEFLIDMGKTETGLNRMYSKSIFIGTKMYSLSFFEKNTKPQPALRNKFFNSFKAG
ncbi:MAG TPA: hypothetical protein VFQ73_00065 [Flavisolibacter sp.]|nr:hypothetical protein [Flavisolibacter sp.]